jgi:hypothetical protein
MNAVDFTTALDIAYKTKNVALVKVVEDAWSVAK